MHTIVLVWSMFIMMVLLVGLCIHCIGMVNVYYVGITGWVMHTIVLVWTMFIMSVLLVGLCIHSIGMVYVYYVGITGWVMHTFYWYGLCLLCWYYWLGYTYILLVCSMFIMLALLVWLCIPFIGMVYVYYVGITGWVMHTFYWYGLCLLCW